MPIVKSNIAKTASHSIPSSCALLRSRILINRIRPAIERLFNRYADYRHVVFQQCESAKYVVFYGTGVIFPGIVDSWQRNMQRKIDFCCDSNPAKWGTKQYGIPCISPQELISIAHESAVFVTANTSYCAISDSLLENGVLSQSLYAYDLETARYIAENDRQSIINNLCSTFDLLEDNPSRRVFMAVVDRIARQSDSMIDVCQPNQYFCHPIELTEYETFIDVGAFDGDTLETFVTKTNGVFEKYVGIELDRVNFGKLSERCLQLGVQDRSNLYNVGLFDRAGTIKYSTADSHSMIGGGETVGQVVCLDDVYKGPATMIKMDIEGAEPAALRGAAGTIIANRPKMAVCVYHAFQHLWEIPQYLKELVPEYRIYLRHHTNLDYETVCYAVTR